MAENSRRFSNSLPLAGARIWLSGAVPEIKGLTEGQRAAILDFVRRLASRVFERGGHIIHGSHPSFTPALLEEARRHQQRGGRKDCLILAVSRLWSKDPEVVPAEEWRKAAVVYETSEATGENAVGKSLQELRTWMVSRSDAIVVAGGKWWDEVPGQPGIPLEVGLAVERGLPCFLLGGFGGAAREFASRHPEVFARLKNGFDEETNREISTREDLGDLAEFVCDRLERLPLVRGRGSDGVSFRILALDGGGLKGAFTAAALATWEEQTGRRIADHFDLIAGTSTGGILAVGLGLGLSGKDLLEFYQKSGPRIFPVMRLRGRIRHNVRHLFRPKYSQKILHDALRDAFVRGGREPVLSDSLCRLVIPAYHAVSGVSHVFRTPHHPDLTADAQTTAAYVALSTAAAPTFFTAAKIANTITESSYFDGGVWANSPAMAAIIEAVCFLRIPVERLDLLSVGTTQEPFTVRGQTRSGVVGWLWKKRILDLLMNVQQESSLKLASQLVTEPRFLRVDKMTAQGTYRLDGPKEIGELADLGYNAATKPDVISKVRSRFLNGITVTPWQRYPTGDDRSGPS